MFNSDNDCDSSFVKEEMKKSTRRKENALEKIDKCASEFGSLQIQIASIMLGFSGLGFLLGGDVVFSQINKVIFLSGFFSLIFSLFLGLVSIDLKQKFWHRICDRDSLREFVWSLCCHDELSRKTTEEIISEISKNFSTKSPDWAWILQTIFLLVGICLFLVLTCGFFY